MISSIFAWFATTRLGRLAGAALLAVGVILGAVRYGTTRERSRATTEALRGALKTQEKVNEVRASDDRDAALERLRDNDIIR